MAEFFADWWWALLLSLAFLVSVTLKPARAGSQKGAHGGGTAGASVEIWGGDSCGGDGGGDGGD